MKFYRYEPHFSEWDVKLREWIYTLVKETECGYWIIHTGLGDKRWIPKQSKKRYAYPTKEEAMRNLLKRSERRAKILKSQLGRTNQLLHLIKSKAK